MRALVTGCEGFIGSHLTEALSRAGWQVIGIDNFLPSYEIEPRRQTSRRLLDLPGFQLVEADLVEADLVPLMADVSVVYHLAAQAGVRRSWDDFSGYLKPNLLSTQRVLGAAAEQGKAKVVFASSSSVYGHGSGFPTPETEEVRPVSPYGVTKAAGEQLASAYSSEFGVNVTVLRYFTVFGPRQRSDMAFHIWIRAALEGTPITVFGDGSTIRDFTYVDDAVRATIGASKLPSGHTVNVAGGKPTTLTEALSVISETTGRDLSIRYVERAKGDTHRTGGDTTLIRRLTDWRPSVSLHDGIEKQVDWMTEQLRRALA